MCVCVCVRACVRVQQPYPFGFSRMNKCLPPLPLLSGLLCIHHSPHTMVLLIHARYMYTAELRFFPFFKFDFLTGSCRLRATLASKAPPLC